MGTTYYASLEVCEEHYWIGISQWSFGKDYALSRALHSSDDYKNDWPIGCDCRDIHCAEYVDGKGNCTAQAFLATTIDNENPVVAALNAAIPVLLGAYPLGVRLLFWES